MSLFFRARRAEQRTIDSFPWSNGETVSLTGGQIASALRLIPLFACTSMVTDSISTCPIKAFRETPEGKQPLGSKPALLQEPGVGVRLTAWLSQYSMSKLLRGNAYGYVAAIGANGLPNKIQWLHPDSVNVDESGYMPIYRVNGREVDPLSIVHIPGVTLPGTVVGLSPVQQFRLQIETGLRVGAYQHDWYNETAIPRGVLSNKSRNLQPGEGEVAKARFKAAVNDHDILVVGNDWQWQPIAPTAADAQFLDAIQANATQIASIFHVSPEEVGGKAGSSLTYQTLEANSIRYVQRAVLPHITPLEEAITAMLPGPQYMKFNLDHLIRTELSARMAAHEVALRIGAETQDEMRAVEDKAPLTPAEIKAWQKYYGKSSTPAPSAPAMLAVSDPNSSPEPPADPNADPAQPPTKGKAQ